MDQILTKDGLIYVLYYNDGSYIRSNATDQEGATDQLYILREKNGICEEVGKVSLKINDPYQNASSEDDLYGDESASYEDGLMWCGKELAICEEYESTDLCDTDRCIGSSETTGWQDASAKRSKSLHTRIRREVDHCLCDATIYRCRWCYQH